MSRAWSVKVFQIICFNTCIILAACTDSVKIVDSDSLLARSNPMSETVFRENKSGDLDQTRCLGIKETQAYSEVVIQHEQLMTFDKALRSFLAPLNYPVIKDCDVKIQLMVRDFDRSNFIIASRYTIDIQGQVSDSEGIEYWSAEYRMSENAGSLPLDPISAGAGIFTAQQNTSDQSIDDGIYVAVRRLLLALPEYSFDQTRLDPKYQKSKQKQINGERNLVTYTNAMTLWEEKKYEEALRIMQKLYNPNSNSTLGYNYGLMLEAMGKDVRASEIYSETAVSQVRENKNGEALKTLRRLQRMNETNGGEFDFVFNKALKEISILTRK